MMRSISLGFCLFALAAAASGGTIDFESTSLGTYSALGFPEINITFTGGSGTFEVQSQSPGPPISGHTLISYFTNPGNAPFRGQFLVSGVRQFSIGVGDYNADTDNTYLEAYDASNNLLASDYYQNPASTVGGSTLNVVTGADIAYVLWRSEAPNAGAVYWDNLSWRTVEGDETPEPGTWATLLGGLGAIGWMRRRKS